MRSEKRRFNYTYLLLTLLALMLLFPYLEGGERTRFVLSAIMISVLLACVYSVSGRKRSLAIGGIFCLPAVAGEIATQTRYLPIIESYGAILSLPLLVYVILHILRNILLTKRVTGDTICGAVCIYLLLGVSWISLYMLMQLLYPGSLAIGGEPVHGDRLPWSDYFYFSFTTLTTLGYGDITPVTSQARSLAMVEAVCGTLYVAVLIAKLVGTHQWEMED